MNIAHAALAGTLRCDDAKHGMQALRAMPVGRSKLRWRGEGPRHLLPPHFRVAGEDGQCVAPKRLTFLEHVSGIIDDRELAL